MTATPYHTQTMPRDQQSPHQALRGVEPLNAVHWRVQSSSNCDHGLNDDPFNNTAGVVATHHPSAITYCPTPRLPSSDKSPPVSTIADKVIFVVDFVAQRSPHGTITFSVRLGTLQSNGGCRHVHTAPHRTAHLGEHLLHVESGAHAQGPEAPPLVGPLRAAALLRPVGVAVHAHQRNVGAEKVARRQHRSVPSHRDHQVYLVWCAA